jgi:uncharacterized protein YndB with AHSA1/START domain
MTTTVERSVDLDVDAEDVWQAITDPAELATWMVAEGELDPVAGGDGRFVDDDGVARRAVVESVEPGRRLVFRWWPESEGPEGASVVTLAVTPRPGGCRLLVTERLAAAARADLGAVARAASTAWLWRLDLLLLRVGAVALARR